MTYAKALQACGTRTSMFPSPETQQTLPASSTQSQAPTKRNALSTERNTSQSLPAAERDAPCIQITWAQVLHLTASPTPWAACTLTHSSQVLHQFLHTSR